MDNTIEEMNNLGFITAIVFLLVLIIAIGIQSAVMSNYKEYYNKTETLIDSIASQNEDFLDTTAEQDVYVEYLEARKKLQ